MTRTDQLRQLLIRRDKPAAPAMLHYRDRSVCQFPNTLCGLYGGDITLDVRFEPRADGGYDCAMDPTTAAAFGRIDCPACKAVIYALGQAPPAP